MVKIGICLNKILHSKKFFLPNKKYFSYLDRLVWFEIECYLLLIEGVFPHLGHTDKKPFLPMVIETISLYLNSESH